jgi:tRNA (guanine-N1)-methyltransferase
MVMVDPSEPMCRAARSRALEAGVGDRCRVHQGFVSELPAETVFDAATCLLVLHFLDEPGQIALLHDIAARLKPGILGKDESAKKESFSEAMLEYPQYTKPEVLKLKAKSHKLKAVRVPKVLLTGHHKNIEEWRKEEALKRTKKRRPDLLIDQN